MKPRDKWELLEKYIYIYQFAKSGGRDAQWFCQVIIANFMIKTKVKPWTFITRGTPA